MRRIARRELSKRVAQYLQRKQVQVDSGADVTRTWERARRTKAMRDVSRTLAQMSGPRNRCMYCEDSRGAQIDHYWPKRRYPTRAFRWTNLLWLCGECNLVKSDHFELGEQGQPLLIDPTAEDPWDFLFFEPATGLITARYVSTADAPDPRGRYTAESGHLPLNIETVQEGRRRVFRALRRAVERFLHSAANSAVGFLQSEQTLLDEIQDHDDYGLAVWFFERDGKDTVPFNQLRRQFADTWGKILRVVCPTRSGVGL